MGKKRKANRRRHGLQGITLCISTALVLILLGMVVMSVLTARNLSAYVKENLTVTMMLGEDMTNPEAKRLCMDLQKRPYISHINYSRLLKNKQKQWVQIRVNSLATTLLLLQ